MAGLQRSAVSVRRQGSSGYVWDDKFLGEVFQAVNQKQDNNQETTGGIEVKPVARTVNTVERSRSNGGHRGYHVERASPGVEPPSPKLSAFGCCGAFGNKDMGRRKKAAKQRSR